MNQSMTICPDVVPADQYTQEKGRYIAELFADGESLKSICEHSEGWLPAMLYVKRWRVMFPAFDALMCEAASCRAENMAEEILTISDDSTAQAAHNRNRMAAREKLAGWMAPASYGDRRASDKATDTDSAPVYVLTDEQLLAIAAGKQLPALDGECETVGADGVHPPTERTPTTEYEVSGPRKPGSKPGRDSVTTTIDYSECELAEDGFLNTGPEIRESIVLPPEDDSEEKNFEEPGDAVRSFVGMG